MNHSRFGIFCILLICATILCTIFSPPSQSQQRILKDENLASCSKPKNGSGILKNLKNLTLYVHIQNEEYERALKCTGIEKTCIQKSMSQPGGELEKKYIDEMIENKKYYKEPIQKNNLIRIFKERLETEISPYAVLKKDCSPPAVTIIDKDFSLSETPGTLTYILTLNISRNTKPAIAILNWTIYRPDISRMNIHYPIAYNNVVAIPLDLSDQEIAENLIAFSKSIQHPRKLAGEK